MPTRAQRKAAAERFAVSVKKTGGASMNAVTGRELRPEDGGYMVGGEGMDTIKHDEGEYRLGQIHRDRQAVLRATRGRRDVFLGAWKDDGKVEIDASRRYDDHSEAMRVARERGEKAVWDVKNGREIRT